MASWFYGRQTVSEILRSGRRALKILISQGVEKNSIQEILRLAREKGLPCQTVPGKVLQSLVQGNHQGVAVQVEPIEVPDFKSFVQNLEVSRQTFVSLLDEIQDPQNLGAIIRSAACFGCSGIILPKHHCAGISPAVMKSSSGALDLVPVVRIANLGVAAERLKDRGFTLIGADSAPSALPIEEVDLQGPVAILLGNEHRGIKPVLKRSCDQLVRIPQARTPSSLNVSNAAAIFFYCAALRAGSLGRPV